MSKIGKFRAWPNCWLINAPHNTGGNTRNKRLRKAERWTTHHMVNNDSNTDTSLVQVPGCKQSTRTRRPTIFEDRDRDQEDLEPQIELKKAAKATRRNIHALRREWFHSRMETANTRCVHEEIRWNFSYFTRGGIYRGANRGRSAFKSGEEMPKQQIWPNLDSSKGQANKARKERQSGVRSGYPNTDTSLRSRPGRTGAAEDRPGPNELRNVYGKNVEGPTTPFLLRKHMEICGTRLDNWNEAQQRRKRKQVHARASGGN
ncbi:hypothetical protein B0H16DRAFT_1461012 [Mycena metata]|uniref:Uncharacterized protein n=1 Tax=Mycena metata TaxID=1033252 RepID=A0AAD7N8P5_9AGAR|nr:hypothetical protein B0H16DRAFT_1461012 [Mycena metata]